MNDRAPLRTSSDTPSGRDGRDGYGGDDECNGRGGRDTCSSRIGNYGATGKKNGSNRRRSSNRRNTPVAGRRRHRTCNRTCRSSHRGPELPERKEQRSKGLSS